VRKSYQKGSVTLKERASLPDLWLLRYREGGIRKSIELGTVKEFPTKSDAEQEADRHRIKIASLGGTKTIGAAIDRYLEEATNVRPHTATTKRSNLFPFRQDWAEKFPASINIMELEKWINGLETRPTKNLPSRPYSKRSKLHIKAEIHCLFESIMRWGDMELGRNPITLVRVKGVPKKTRHATIITVDQYQKLREITDPHVSMMIMLSMCLGLRVSEVLGLKWENINFASSVMSVEGSSVGKHQSDTKTLASNDELPLHPQVLDELKAWKATYPSMNGWIFESLKTGRPFHNGIMQKKHLVPAGLKLEPKIASLGWHDFRHTYRSMMRELELPIEVQQRLMRHSDIRTTTGYGGRKMELRAPNAELVEFVSKRKKA
jgi:integrase